MKRFHFRLESVLSYRKALETARQEELVAARHRLQQQIDCLNALKNHREQLFHSARQQRLQGVHVCQEELVELYLQNLEIRMLDQEERIREAQEVVDRCLQAVIEAMKERKALEQLKERHREAYLAEAGREDMAVLDEMASLRANRASA